MNKEQLEKGLELQEKIEHLKDNVLHSAKQCAIDQNPKDSGWVLSLYYNQGYGLNRYLSPAIYDMCMKLIISDLESQINALEKEFSEL